MLIKLHAAGSRLQAPGRLFPPFPAIPATVTRPDSWPGKNAQGQQAGMAGLAASMILMGAPRCHGAHSLRSPESAE
jgi:hypothetical protein